MYSLSWSILCYSEVKIDKFGPNRIIDKNLEKSDPTGLEMLQQMGDLFYYIKVYLDDAQKSKAYQIEVYYL